MAYVYSCTYPLASGRDRRGGDPLYAAWASLGRARELPFDESASAAWFDRFTLLARAAADGVAEHVGCDERCPAADSRPAAHDEVVRTAARLLATCTSTGIPELRDVIALNERAIALEIAIARHQNRLRVALGVSGAASEELARLAS